MSSTSAQNLQKLSPGQSVRIGWTLHRCKASVLVLLQLTDSGHVTQCDTMSDLLVQSLHMMQA